MLNNKLHDQQEKLKKESHGKKCIRRILKACFLPNEYLKYGITKKDYFKKDLLKALKKCKKEGKK